MFAFLNSLLKARTEFSLLTATGRPARRQRKPGCVLILEALESRIVPSVQMQGDDLVVVGTSGNDQIVINPGGPGEVKVLMDGVSQAATVRPAGSSSTARAAMTTFRSQARSRFQPVSTEARATTSCTVGLATTCLTAAAVRMCLTAEPAWTRCPTPTRRPG
jgi:hypothetical protein